MARLAILRQGLEIGTHDLPCSAVLRCLRNLGRRCFALLDRAAQAFNGHGAINKPSV